MKFLNRIVGILVLWMAFLPAASAEPAELNFGLNFLPSPVWNGTWSPDIQGWGLSVETQLPLGPGMVRAGLEFDIDALGSQILLPVGFGLTLADIVAPGEGGLAWRGRLSLAVLPGLALFRPAPLAIIGGEIRWANAWFWNESWGFELTLGARWLTCPDYSRLVGYWESWEIPLGVGLVFRAK